MKKIISILLALVTVTACVGMISASAATSWPSLSQSNYCEFTAAGTIPVYRNSNCSTRGTSSPAKSYNAYIDPGDVCRIYSISSSSVLLAYPTSSGMRTGYVKRSAVLGVSAPTEKITSKGTAYTYATAGGKSWGYVERNDSVYRCGTSNGYVAVIYTARSGNRGFKYAYVTSSDYNGAIKGNSTPGGESTPVNTSSWQYPMANAYVCGNNWATYYSPRASAGRPYHACLDLGSRTGDGNVYAAASGTVAAVGYNSANGYFVIIRHTISGTTVYSFYAHLSTYSVSKGQSVSKGKKIGVFGNTGSASAGAHLHFAITNALYTGGGYYGYVSSISGNKCTYGGATYYNPAYVIQYNRLP